MPTGGSYSRPAYKQVEIPCSGKNTYATYTSSCLGPKSVVHEIKVNVVQMQTSVPIDRESFGWFRKGQGQPDTLMTVTEVELFTNCCFRCTHWPGIYGPSPPSYVKASYKAGMMVTALASLLLPQFSSTSGANTLWELHLSPTTSMTTLSRDSLIHLFRPSDSVCTNTVVDIHSFIQHSFMQSCTGSAQDQLSFYR